MNITVLGAGFLGQRFAAEIPGARLAHVDITDKAAVLSALRTQSSDIVINAAGKTGRPNVDWCEIHPTETYRSHVVGALTVAEACAERGIYLLHLGSACVFFGESPRPGGWREDDVANPCSFYTRSKYAAELVLSQLPNVAIARVRMPIDGIPHPRNVLTKLAAYRYVIDVRNSVTVVDDLVHAVQVLIARRATGIFHITNPGTVANREILSLYRELVDPAHRYNLIREEELFTRGLAIAKRSNCLIASRRLEEMGIQLRPIKSALPEVMKKYASAIKHWRAATASNEV